MEFSKELKMNTGKVSETSKFLVVSLMVAFLFFFSSCYAPPYTYKSSQNSVVLLKWAASMGGSGLITYSVYRNGALIAKTGETFFRDHSAAIGGGAYSYVVVAADKLGRVSDPSNRVIVHR
jgi:hypothetical protein